MTKVQQLWKEEIRKTFDPLQDLLGGLNYNLLSTPYKKKPELLIIGRNRIPAIYKYSAKFESSKNLITQCKKESGYSSYENEIICRLFGYRKKERLWNFFENTVGINYLYFNEQTVRNSADKSLQKKILNACLHYTRLLIDEYIRPKHILSIGNLPFCKMRMTPLKEDLQWGCAHAWKGYRNKIPIYYILDPAGKVHYYNSDVKIDDYSSLFEHIFL